MARTWSLGLSAFPFRFMVTIQWKHFSTKQYRNQVNIVFSQLTWEKRDFLHVPRQPSAEGTWAFCSTETWPGIGEADYASKLKPHFFNTFYTLNWKTNKWIWGYWWKWTWEQNQKPSKESRWACSLLSWCLQSWPQPAISRWIPSKCWSHTQFCQCTVPLTQSIAIGLVLELPPSYHENKIFSLQMHSTSDLHWAWQNGKGSSWAI